GARLLGWSPEEIIGRNWIENFVPADRHEEIWREFYGIMASGEEQSRHFQNPVLTRSGGETEVFWHFRCIRDEHGGVLKVVTAGMDVSSRSRAEQDLEKSEARAAAVLNSVVDGVVTIDERGII